MLHRTSIFVNAITCIVYKKLIPSQQITNIFSFKSINLALDFLKYDKISLNEYLSKNFKYQIDQVFDNQSGEYQVVYKNDNFDTSIDKLSAF